MKEELKKAKYILWKNYGYEGLSPEIFNTFEEAVNAEKYSSEWVITQGAIDYKVTVVEG